MRLLTILSLMLMVGCTAIEEAQERNEIALQEREQHLKEVRENACPTADSCRTRTIYVRVHTPGVGTSYGSVRVPR